MASPKWLIFEIYMHTIMKLLNDVSQIDKVMYVIHSGRVEHMFDVENSIDNEM